MSPRNRGIAPSTDGRTDGRTTRHEGYALSIKNRKPIEEAFGWAKTVGGMAQTMYRGIERVRSRFILTMAANNLARLLAAARGLSLKSGKRSAYTHAERLESKSRCAAKRKTVPAR